MRTNVSYGIGEYFFDLDLTRFKFGKINKGIYTMYFVGFLGVVKRNR